VSRIWKRLPSSCSSDRATPSLAAFAALTSFYLKAFDRHLIDRPGALDAASAVYFLGQKSEHTLTDRELVRRYRGALLG